MLLIRKHHEDDTEHAAPTLVQDKASLGLSLQETVRVRHSAGHSQRAIARDLNIDRRKVKQIIDGDAA